MRRRRPIFPRSCPRSIIGAEELNDRVRDGYGCALFAIVTSSPAHTGDFFLDVENNTTVEVDCQGGIGQGDHNLRTKIRESTKLSQQLMDRNLFKAQGEETRDAFTHGDAIDGLSSGHCDAVVGDNDKLCTLRESLEDVAEACHI